jgi:site-specific DNA recombinase
MPRKNDTVTPRNGHTLVVGIVARISGGPNQKDVSLEDQIDHAKQEVTGLYHGPVEYVEFVSKNKGERLDRPELEEIERVLRSGRLDLLVCEDLGRLVRGTEAKDLCGLAVDHGTRVIAPNDCIDTADETWEEDAISACRDHVGHNAHTSKRLKQKLMNRFVKSGGATAREIMGYIKPEGAKTYDDWIKDEEATAIYLKWFQKLKETQNCSEVADWLNLTGVPLGKYARRGAWNGQMVRRVTANPILKGLPYRGRKRTVKRHETGRRVSVLNPEGPRFRECPHLAHVPADLFDEVNALLDAENRGFGRKPVNGSDPLAGVPRQRTRFPGQHARCGYCGRPYVWGGNGDAGRLMCTGAREWRCWNSVSFDGALAAKRLVEAITAELFKLDGFDAQLRALVEQARAAGGDREARLEHLRREAEELRRQRENVADAIAQLGLSPALKDKHEVLEGAERALARRRRELENAAGQDRTLPTSVVDLRRLFEDQFMSLAIDSPEFARLVRPLVPEFSVRLVRLLDGGDRVPRATVALRLAALTGSPAVPELDGLLTRRLTIDLFEPPQREQIRAEAVRLRDAGLNQREIDQRLAGQPTQTAVYRALRFDDEMKRAGLDSPYVPVTEPPTGSGRRARHRNKRYRFEPLADFSSLTE